MIVADASLVVLGLLNDGDARALMAAEQLAVPHLADSEIVHALRAQVLLGSLSAETAMAALEVWTKLGVRRFPAAGLLGRIWELRDNLSGYDATYVALAEALGAPLATADGRLGIAPGPDCPITVARS